MTKPMNGPILLDVDGGLAAEVFLGGRGVPLVAVPGTPCLATAMRPVLDAASLRPRAAVELPGHGRTPAVTLEGDLLLDDCARQLSATLDALGWSRCVGVAHSGAVAILARAALIDPGQFSAMLLFAPTGELPAQRSVRSQTASIIPERLSDALDLALEFFHPPATRERVRERWRADFARISGKSSAALLRAFGESRDVLPELAALKIPTTVVISDADRSVMAEESEGVARLLSAAILRVPGDHFAFDEAPVEAAAAVRGFLAGV